MSVTDEAYRNVVELLTSRINKIADLESRNADLLAWLDSQKRVYRPEYQLIRRGA